MGPSPRGRRMPVAWLAGPQTPRSVEPLAAVCLEETRASEASWLWGSSSALSASRTPVPKPWCVVRKPDLLHILRESVAVLPLASLALQDSRFFCENFWNFSSSSFRLRIRSSLFSGLPARRSLPAAAILFRFCILISTRYTSRTEARPTFEPAAHLVLLAVGEQF